MSQSPLHPDRIDAETLREAEEIFLSLAQTQQFAFYFGRYPDLFPEELRALFGLAIASIRQASRADEIAAGGGALREVPSQPEPAPKASRDDQGLEARLEAMLAELARRDEKIQELTRELRKHQRKGS